MRLRALLMLVTGTVTQVLVGAYLGSGTVQRSAVVAVVP